MANCNNVADLLDNLTQLHDDDHDDDDDNGGDYEDGHVDGDAGFSSEWPLLIIIVNCSSN